LLEASKNNINVLQFSINKGNQWPKNFFFKDYMLSNRVLNNVFLDNKQSAYVCVDIVADGLELVNVIARKFVSLENAHRQPYLSSDENIFSAHNVSAETFIILLPKFFQK
jgi:hypothetical protein